MTTTGKKITDFTSLTSIADSDIMLAVDVSDTTSSPEGTTKKVLFSEVKGDITSGLNISNWDVAFSWGNHASGGYITSETDPVFAAHPSSDITLTKIGQWDTAYGWGNHAVQGYLQSISTQSINSLSDVDTTGVATNNVLKWSGTSWIPGTASGSGTTINELNDVGDVDLTVAPTANQVLKYDIATSKWKAGDDLNSGGLNSLSAVNASAGVTNLSFNSGTGVFTYTPPDLSSYLQNIVEDTSPQLGGNLDLDTNIINGPGTINITGDIKGDTFRLTNNATTPSSGNRREIKVIGQAPYFYDGTDWRPFFLIDAPTQIPADTDWDNVMFRATFDSSFDDIKYNATPTRSSNTDTALVSSPVKVGAKSLRLDDAYIDWDTTNTTRYDFTGAWTMEAWVYIDDITSFDTPDVIFSGNSSTSTKNWGLLIYKPTGTADLKFSWMNRNNSSHDSEYGTNIVTLSASSYIGSWHHIAYVKDSTTGAQTLYINGSSYGTVISDNEILTPDEFSLGYQEYWDYDFDGMIDDLRISKSTRYTSNFTAPATQLPVSGSTTQILPPPADKKGEITLGSSPTWTGSSGITVAQQSSGTYRLTFPSAYSNANDYFIIAQGMDHNGSASSYIRVARTTGYVDVIVKSQADDTNIDTGAVGIQLINHN